MFLSMTTYILAGVSRRGLAATLLLCAGAAGLALNGMGQSAEERRVHLNQVGFYPEAPKVAVVEGAPSAGPFHVVTRTGGDTVHTGTLGPMREAELSRGRVRAADFSPLDESGRYVLHVPGVGQSYPFAVTPRVHRGVTQAALKGFYFQRASTALPKRFAGRWQRAAGHPDTSVIVHPSAATQARPAGTRISASKGWYDAGDYGKYVVNSGISTATLLSLYEDFPAFARQLGVYIPEGTDTMPDVLNESLWNLQWMLRMQDPADGGVYHKLTTPDFEAKTVAPAEAAKPRYVVQKSTAATLDFAAVMAQASRIFRNFEDQKPGLADTLRHRAVEAWTWARRNPRVIYDQERLNERFDPDIKTGRYGGRDLSDEFAWAAAELYATTGKERFVDAVPDLFPADEVTIPKWGRVRTMGLFTLARQHDTPPDGGAARSERAQRLIVQKADALVRGADTSAYHTVMGQSADDFAWGSNSVAANQGMLLVWAYRLTGDDTYLHAALSNLDYLLGRNPTGYSFVTGIGEKTPMHPHHRPSISDDVRAPVPGLLVGGPNPKQQDGCEYPSDAPALSYADSECAYASNEVTINWNAPLVYLAGALEALQAQAGDAPR